MREAHRMLPIPLNLILRKVLRQIVAFSHSHHRVAHIHPRRFHNGRRISAMERGIRQLVFIVLGIGIGQVNGLLPRISARHNQFYFFCQGYSGGQSGIHTCGMYLAVVCHLPRIGGGKSHNLIRHIVVVTVERKGNIIEHSPSGFAPCDTDIIFVRFLGPQIAVAQPVVIEVIESGQTERTLIHQPEIQ